MKLENPMEAYIERLSWFNTSSRILVATYRHIFFFA